MELVVLTTHLERCFIRYRISNPNDPVIYLKVNSAGFLLAAAILWIIGDADRSQAKLSVKVLIPVALFLSLLGIDEIIYFFPMALVFSLVATALTVYGVARIESSGEK